ncbi:MFS transporter [Candidatus Bathyarchaeota archaeon]|nr:MFS transporter [Candidatus Bathyarchaeota archaeon]
MTTLKQGKKVSQQPTRKTVFLNLALFQFLSFVRRGIFYTFMINYLFMLMKTVTYTTMLGTMNMVASALGQNLLWGRISDRHKLRVELVITGEAIAAAFYFIVYLIHKALLSWQADFAAGLSLILGLSLLEFFWSMSDVGWAALLTDATTSRNRGGIVGTLNFIASLGRMIGINFAGFLYNDGQGFREGTIFYIVIAMLITSAAIMIVASRLIKKNTTTKGEKNLTNNDYDVASSYSSEKYNWFLVSLIIVVVGATCISQVFLLFLQLPTGLGKSAAEMSLILTAWTLGGMPASLTCGWISDKIGKEKTLLAGLVLAILTPLGYSLSTDLFFIAAVYGLNGMSFWTVQTVGFALAGDIIPKDKRGRLFSKYNTVMALSWGPSGLLVGGPLADFQTRILGLPTNVAYINTFYASSIIVAVGTALFAAKVAKMKAIKS